MPELPEVETVRRTLEPRLTGRVIEGASVGEYRPIVATPSAEEFEARMRGRTINAVGRRGKLLLLRLDSRDTVTIHLRMTGELSLVPASAPRGPHMHLHLDLDQSDQLRYYDIRKFGRWSLLSEAQYETFDRSVGVEPFDSGLSDARFHALLQGRKRVLKPLLLDQAFIAGIGNIYADEALFRSGIHPERRSNELTEAESGALLGAIRAVLLEALEHRGTTLRNYRDSNGQPGGNLPRLQIYSRAAGEPCPRCGGPVVRAVVGQRGTRYCPVCQPVAFSEEKGAGRR